MGKADDDLALSMEVGALDGIAINALPHQLPRRTAVHQSTHMAVPIRAQSSCSDREFRAWS